MRKQNQTNQFRNRKKNANQNNSPFKKRFPNQGPKQNQNSPTRPGQQWRLNRKNAPKPDLKTKIEKNLSKLKSGNNAFRKAQEAYYSANPANKPQNANRSPANKRNNKNRRNNANNNRNNETGMRNNANNNRNNNKTLPIHKRLGISTAQIRNRSQNSSPIKQSGINKITTQRNQNKIVKNTNVKRRMNQTAIRLNQRQGSNGTFTVVVPNNLAGTSRLQRINAPRHSSELNPRIQREIALIQNRNKLQTATFSSVNHRVNYIPSPLINTRLQPVPSAAILQDYGLNSSFQNVQSLVASPQVIQRPMTLNERFSVL